MVTSKQSVDNQCHNVTCLQCNWEVRVYFVSSPRLASSLHFYVPRCISSSASLIHSASSFITERLAFLIPYSNIHLLVVSYTHAQISVIHITEFQSIFSWSEIWKNDSQKLPKWTHLCSNKCRTECKNLYALHHTEHLCYNIIKRINS